MKGWRARRNRGPRRRRPSRRCRRSRRGRGQRPVSKRGRERKPSAANGKGKNKPSLPKRFYKDVAVTEDGAAASALKLDGKTVRTPGKAELVLPTRALADAVAEEWRAQGERIDPATMPLTKLANSAIDGVPAASRR